MAKTLDYQKLTLQQMMDFIKEYHNDDASKAAFKAVALKKEVEKKLVEVKDEQGNPVLTSKGKPKKIRVSKEGGKEIVVKDIFAAKTYFFNTYKDEINFKNAPKAKAEDAIKAELESW